MKAAHNLTPYEDTTCPGCREKGTIQGFKATYDYKGTPLPTTLRVCSDCGWRRMDVPRVHFDAVCAEPGCGKGVGHWSHYADKKPLAYVCAGCTKKRVAEKRHDRKGTHAVFQLKCRDCGESLPAHTSHPEGKFLDLPDDHQIMICASGPCADKRSKTNS
jgi:hypothetical protein